MASWELKGKLALLVLDMQYDIVGEGGGGEVVGFPKACKESGIIPKIQSLLKKFREKKLPVVYVVAEYNPLIPIPIYGTFNDYMREAKPNAPGTNATEIIPEVAPVWGEPVVKKWNIGIFSNSNLDQVLKHPEVFGMKKIKNTKRMDETIIRMRFKCPNREALALKKMAEQVFNEGADKEVFFREIPENEDG